MVKYKSNQRRQFVSDLFLPSSLTAVNLPSLVLVLLFFKAALTHLLMLLLVHVADSFLERNFFLNTFFYMTS